MDQKFSVSMCVYGKDNPVWFDTAVKSILDQSVKPSEVVLVVDGPVPTELDQIIEKYEAEPFFKVIRLEKNQGHGNARRAGFAACTNELIAVMDADDVSAYDRFEKQLSLFAQNENADVVGGQITEFIDDEQNIVGKRIVPVKDAEIKAYIKDRCPMNLVTVMFKKSSVERAGGFIDWYCEEDYYLWVRMFLSDMTFANVDDILVNVRVGKDMYNRRGGFKYFKSEAKLQKYMFSEKIISLPTFSMNTAKRFIVQVLMPNKLRGWIFKKYARR